MAVPTRRARPARGSLQMRDMHCHILPGVDDGAKNLDESLAMLDAAVETGVTSLVCTPHCREPFFDFAGMWNAFCRFKSAARLRHPDVELRMGFEVNYRTLQHIGFEWADKLGFSRSAEFLLELSTRASRSDFAQYERSIFTLQSMGYQVVIAHPERYRAVQEDLGIAAELVNMGCKLQVSADFIDGGRLGNSKKPAIRLLKEGLCSYIASDAHEVRHYQLLSKALGKYGSFLRAS